MKNTYVYHLLIIFVIFLAYKKIISIIIEKKFPTYKDLKNSSSFWKFLVKLREINAIISIIACAYFLYNFKLNYFIRVIFYIVFVNSILYFLIDEQLIYLFVDKTVDVKEVVHTLNVYSDGAVNIIIALFAVYSLIVIFGNTN
jgi:hypothetical protein